MTRIEHFAVFGDDLEALRAFYTEALGLRVVVDNSRAPVRGYFLGDESGTALEIIERPAGTPALSTRYVCHAAFLVEDYPSTRAALEARGVGFEEGTEVLDEAMQTGFFHDPAGNRCQIVWRARPLGQEQAR